MAGLRRFRYEELSYIDSVHRSGIVWKFSVMVLLLAFPLTVAALFGAAPTGAHWWWA